MEYVKYIIVGLLYNSAIPTHGVRSGITKSTDKKKKKKKKKNQVLKENFS